MNSSFTILEQSDGHKTKLYCLPAKTSAIGSVLVLHGMAEYCDRYESFAHVLNNAGYDVYLYNHRGHGPDCALDELGFFAKSGGAELVIEDAVTVCRYIKEQGRCQNFAVLGHSMGSLILRNVITRYDSMDCAIVCGSTMPGTLLVHSGSFLANLLCLLQGAKHRSSFLDSMMFGSKNYRRLCTKTSFDWLTREESVVDWYIQSPYCGFLCTASMYRDLLLFTKEAGSKKNIVKTRKDLPIYFIAGDKDPVGGYGSQIRTLFHVFEQSGFSDISLTLYPEARHELLNETNKEEITNDILAFLKKHSKSSQQS